MLDTLVTLAAVVVTIFQAVYYRSERFYLFINKIFHFLFNRTAYWDLEIDFSGMFTISDLKSIDTLVFNTYPDIKIHDRITTRTTYLFEGTTLDVKLDTDISGDSSDNQFRHLVIHLHQLRASYRDTKELVASISRLAEKIKDKSQSDKVKYGAVISFKGKNPYFGLYVRRLRISDVEAFTCIFHVDNSKDKGAAESTISIGKQSISISSPNLSDLQILSMKYLCLEG